MASAANSKADLEKYKKRLFNCVVGSVLLHDSLTMPEVEQAWFSETKTFLGEGLRKAGFSDFEEFVAEYPDELRIENRGFLQLVRPGPCQNQSTRAIRQLIRGQKECPKKPNPYNQETGIYSAKVRREYGMHGEFREASSAIRYSAISRSVIQKPTSRLRSDSAQVRADNYFCGRSGSQDPCVQNSCFASVLPPRNFVSSNQNSSGCPNFSLVNYPQQNHFQQRTQAGPGNIRNLFKVPTVSVVHSVMEPCLVLWPVYHNTNTTNSANQITVAKSYGQSTRTELPKVPKWMSNQQFLEETHKDHSNNSASAHQEAFQEGNDFDWTDSDNPGSGVVVEQKRIFLGANHFSSLSPIENDVKRFYFSRASTANSDDDSEPRASSGSLGPPNAAHSSGSWVKNVERTASLDSSGNMKIQVTKSCETVLESKEFGGPPENEIDNESEQDMTMISDDLIELDPSIGLNLMDDMPLGIRRAETAESVEKLLPFTTDEKLMTNYCLILRLDDVSGELVDEDYPWELEQVPDDSAAGTSVEHADRCWADQIRIYHGVNKATHDGELQHEQEIKVSGSSIPPWSYWKELMIARYG